MRLGREMDMDSPGRFSRNLGVLAPDQQERLARSRVLIVGCGGVGGAVAAALARSGVGAFTLVDFDDFEPTNLNRQITCTGETLGRNKAEVLAEHLISINPDITVDAIPRLVDLADIDPLIEPADLVFPAADDYAYSLMVFRRTRALNKPALMVVPAGLWATVALISPRGPSPEHLHGVPHLAGYEELADLFGTWDSKIARSYYVTLGGWHRDYFVDHVADKVPIAQLCSSVWLASSLGALEVVKQLSGHTRATFAPRYWLMTDRGGVGRAHMYLPNSYSVQVWYRRLAWPVLNSPLGGVVRWVHRLWWRWFSDGRS
jgi:tRNA threonylcarbamoyladenosine dehydratase